MAFRMTLSIKKIVLAIWMTLLKQLEMLYSIKIKYIVLIILEMVRHVNEVIDTL